MMKDNEKSNLVLRVLPQALVRVLRLPSPPHLFLPGLCGGGKGVVW